MHSRSSTTPLAELRPAAAWLFLWARGGVSLGCSRPCALACHGKAGLRRRAARNRIAAGAFRVGAGRYSAAPSGLPRVPPKKVRRCRASHRCRVVARKAIQSGPGGPGLAGLAVGPVIARPRRGRAARLGLSGRTLRGPSPSAAARPFASASAPGGGEVRACPPLRRGAAPCTTAAPRPPPCAGPGSCPGPCRDRRLRRPLRRAGFNF